MAYTGKKPTDHTDVTQSQSMTVTDDLTVDTDTLYVDSANNNVGIGTTSPSGYSSAYRQLVINGGANPSMLQLNNTTTGQGINSGGLAMVQSGVDAYVINPQSTGTTRFFTNNTERLRIQSGGGISFNGDTSAANALDDYEEGTWTPTVDQGTLSYSTCRYVKVGNTVTVTGVLSSFSNRTSTSDMVIRGLPFATTSDDMSIGVTLHRYVNNVGDHVVFYLGGNRSYIVPYGCRDSGNYDGVQHAHLASSSASFHLTMTYIIS